MQQALRGGGGRARLPDHGRPARVRQACIDWLARRSGSPGSASTGAADDRLQGAGRLAADPARARRRATWWCTRRWPIRPTRWARPLVGRRGVATDSLTAVGPRDPRWCGSTRRPTRPGGCCRPTTCARWSTGAASAGALLVSDECYLECAWEAEPVSVLHPDICGGSLEGILAVHSLSKRSNLAGYRGAFVAGDPAVVGELLAVRKHLGLMMPGAGAARDGRGARRRRARGGAARPLRGPSRCCAAALEAAGFRIDHSEGALYLWATRGRGLLGHRRLARRARHPGRAGRVLRPGRRPARPGRPHRHRRAHRRRGRAPAPDGAHREPSDPSSRTRRDPVAAFAAAGLPAVLGVAADVPVLPANATRCGSGVAVATTNCAHRPADPAARLAVGRPVTRSWRDRCLSQVAEGPLGVADQPVAAAAGVGVVNHAGERPPGCSRSAPRRATRASARGRRRRPEAGALHLLRGVGDLIVS